MTDSNVIEMKIRNLSKNMLGIAAIIAALVVIFSVFYTVDAGVRVVVLRFGDVHRISEPGLHMKIPFVDSLVPIDVRIQKSVTKTESSSKDLQIVTSEIALNYHLEPTEVGTIYERLQLAWERRIIDPAIRESMKSITAQYTAEDLITQRSAVSAAIKDRVRELLKPYGLNVDEISITEFNFSSEFNRAIESKQTAEQMALKAKRDLDRIRIEADQKVAAARAEAESLRIQREVVSAQLIQLRQIEVQKSAIDKWDGHLPDVTGGAVPFIKVD